MNNALAKMAAEFDALRSRWGAMEPGEEQDDVCEQLGELAAQICAVPVDDLAGLAAKARAVVWAESLDFQPLIETDAGFVMAEFVLELARAGN